MMHAAVLFINIGFYHAARLRATFETFNEHGWQLTAMQLTNDALEHPWGDAEAIITFPVVTLLPSGYEPKGKSLLPDVPGGEIERHLSELKPDVVFLPGWSFALSVTALRWCRRNNVPAVVMSESKRDDEMRTWWKESLKSLLYVRKFSAALVGGNVHADYIASLGVPRERIFTGYDAVDNEHFIYAADMAQKDMQAARKRYPSIPERPYFLVVTRLIHRKNVARLLKAYVLYRNNVAGIPWDLVICGQGEQKAQLEESVHLGGLDEFVHFPGFVSYHDVGFWYGLAGAFVHPALNEQWGLVVNEACAAGLPILCSNTVGACYDLVRENVNGFLFDPKATDDIAQSLLRMHETPPETRKRMGEESRLVVQLCSPKTFASGFVAAARVATEKN
jgi:glycosyltransferase involved in cell wall biosynthesis